MELILIREHDLHDGTHDIIGIADSVENEERMINGYYRDFEEILHNDVRDSSIEYEKTLLVKSVLGDNTVKICLQWFTLNCV